MFVDDVTDKAELLELLAEVRDWLVADPGNEQAVWDQEDIQNRLAEL